MKIDIKSREGMEKYANEPFPARTALVSITDKDYDFIVLKNKPEYILQMKFDDVSNEVSSPRNIIHTFVENHR